MYKLTCTVPNGLCFVFRSYKIHDLIRIGVNLNAYKLNITLYGEVIYAITLH